MGDAIDQWRETVRSTHKAHKVLSTYVDQLDDCEVIYDWQCKASAAEQANVLLVVFPEVNGVKTTLQWATRQVTRLGAMKPANKKRLASYLRIADELDAEDVFAKSAQLLKRY